MAEKYWLGADATYPYKYTTTANWSGGALPVTGDDVYFDDRANADPADAAKKCKCTDFTSMTVLDLKSFNLKPTFNADIGDGTANGWYKIRLEESSDTRQVVFEGVANCYLKVDIDTTNARHVERVICKGAAGSILNLITVNSANTTGGGFKLVECHSGYIIIGASSVVTKLLVADNATVLGKNGIIGDSLTAYPNTDIHQVNGVVTWHSNFKDIELCGGIFNWGSIDDTTYTGLRRSTGLLRIYRGATFNWNARDDQAVSPNYTSVLKKFIVFPYGNLVATSAVNKTYLKQIGAASGDYSEVFVGGQALFDNGTRNIAVLSGCGVKLRGGTMSYPPTNPIAW